MCCGSKWVASCIPFDIVEEGGRDGGRGERRGFVECALFLPHSGIISFEI